MSYILIKIPVLKWGGVQSAFVSLFQFFVFTISNTLFDKFFIVSFDVEALRCKEPLNILSWHKQNDSRCSDKSLHLQQVGDNPLSALDAIYVYGFFLRLLLYLNMNTFLKKTKQNPCTRVTAYKNNFGFSTRVICFLNINYNWILPKH